VWINGGKTNMIRKASLAITVVLVTAVVVIYQLTIPRVGWERDDRPIIALTTTIFWEGAIAEPIDGLHAIAHVILNRTRSKDFPNTITKVVVQGMEPGKKTGCQFSFACDGQVETPTRLCELHPKDTAMWLGPLGCERRWLIYLALSAYWYYLPGDDPTEGATLYFVGKKPYWFSDLVVESVRRIGSHTYGRSKWIGRDLAHKN